MAETFKSYRQLMRPEDLAEQARVAALAEAGNHEAVRRELDQADLTMRLRLENRRTVWTH